MLSMIKNELLKLWLKKSFFGILIILTAVNLLMLWYTENIKTNAFPPSAYKTLASDINKLSEEEKLSFIEEKHQTLGEITAWNEIIMIEAEAEAGTENEYASGLIAQIREEHPNLDQYKVAYESRSYLRYTSSIESEIAFIGEILGEITKVSGYSAMLEDIEKQASRLSRVSIFGGDSKENDTFSSKNIKKTADDYRFMNNIPIKYGVTKGFNMATDFLITDIIALVIMLLLSTLLIYDEKDKGLFALIKSTARGRGTTAAAKIAALCVNMLLVTVLLFGANLIYAEIVYGLPDFSQSLQSIPEFLGSTLKLSTGQYLLLFLASKFFAYFTVSLFVLLIALLSRHPAVTYILASAVLAASYAVYITIPAISSFNIIKFINLISFVRTNGMYQGYLNLNIGGRPVNLILSVWTAISVVFFILFTLVCIVFCKKKNMQSGEIPFKKLWQKITLFKYRPSASIFRHELYKLLIVNKVLPILVLFIVFMWYGSRDAKFYTPFDDSYYKSYMTGLSGGITSEKEEFLRAEQTKYDDAEKAVNAINALVESGQMTFEQSQVTASSYNAILMAKPTFERVMERYEYIKAHPKAQFVYDTGYNRLFGLTANNDTLSALMLILICVVCFSALFPLEYKTGALRIIGAAPLGKSVTNKNKVLVSVVTVIPFFAAVYAPDILLVKRFFVSLNAPIISLPAFSHFPSFVPIWGYIAILYLTRLAVCIALLLAVLAISRSVKSSIPAMLFGLALFIAPVVLYLMGIGFVYPFTLLPLFTANELYTGSFSPIFTAVFAAVPIVMGSLGVWRITK